VKELSRCGLTVNNSFNYCPRCGRPLNVEAFYEKLKEVEKKDKEVEEVKKLIDKLLELALRNPNLIKHLLAQEDQ